MVKEHFVQGVQFEDKNDNMENDILRQNQFFNSDPKKQYEMVNEHFSNLRTQLLIIETVRRKTSIK